MRSVQDVRSIQDVRSVSDLRTKQDTFTRQVPKIPKEKTPPPPIPNFKSVGKYNQNLQLRKLQKSYSVYVGSGKKEKLVGTGLTRGRALLTGARRTLSSLKARFRIKETGVTSMEDINYRPSEKSFREYRVSKGQKIYTPDTFVQRRSERLSTASERQLIKSAKQTKSLPNNFRGGQSKWF